MSLRRQFLLLMLMLGSLSALVAQKAPAPPKFAPPKFDKAKFETYIRHMFVWPDPIQITVSDPEASEIAGIFKVKIKASQGEASQEEVFYLSADGQKVMRGDLFNLTQNPFKPDLDKLKTEGQPSFGTPGAPVVVAEFSDFECPFCRQEAKILRDNILKTYPKEVRAYFMDFPLESLHPWAKDAAIAGRCIFHQKPDVFWDYHDWIFASQESITPETVKARVAEFAAGKGIDLPEFNSCLTSTAAAAEVQRTRDMGHSLDVDQTPTIFINGRRMVGAAAWPDLQRVIDYEIEYQKTAKDAGDDCGCEVKLPVPGLAPAKKK